MNNSLRISWGVWRLERRGSQTASSPPVQLLCENRPKQSPSRVGKTPISIVCIDYRTKNRIQAISAAGKSGESPEIKSQSRVIFKFCEWTLAKSFTGLWTMHTRNRIKLVNTYKRTELRFEQPSRRNSFQLNFNQINFFQNKNIRLFPNSPKHNIHTFQDMIKINQKIMNLEIVTHF